MKRCVAGFISSLGRHVLVVVETGHDLVTGGSDDAARVVGEVTEELFSSLIPNGDISGAGAVGRLPEATMVCRSAVMLA